MTKTKQSGAADSEGTEVTRFNAFKHGVLSRYTVLPWESAAEYSALAACLVAEHTPEGPTEEHLVEELAGILWRKRRLRLAEGAAYRRGLKDTLASFSDTAKAALAHLGDIDPSERVADAIKATDAVLECDVEGYESSVHRALNRLNSKRDDAYETALSALDDDMQRMWTDMLARSPNQLREGETSYTADAESFRRFLTGQMLPWLARLKNKRSNLTLIREQAFADALNVEQLEQLARYEVHLDRKLERMLAMLLRLKDLRQGAVPA